jgi:hypothetical protein
MFYDKLIISLKNIGEIFVYNNYLNKQKIINIIFNKILLNI